MNRLLQRHMVMWCIATASLLCHSSPAYADLSGFSAFASVNTSGSARSAGYNKEKTTLLLTDGGREQAASAFAREPQSLVAFDAAFTYRAEKKVGELGDGIVFVLQNDPRGTAALGKAGGDLGYGGDNGIRSSFAIRLGLYGGSGEGTSIGGKGGFFSDTVPVDTASGHPIRVSLHYDGAVLTEILRDQTTGQTVTIERAVDLARVVGKNAALIGFTGASGNATAVQTVGDFTFRELPPVPVAQRKRPAAVTRPHKTLSSYVDPFIGTASDGNTYPGAVAPFGMVQFSPDTHDGSIGYFYSDRAIRGFSMMHMSGVGCNNFGDVFMTATSGPLKTNADDYASAYSHRQESAAPGYYQVKLLRPNVNVELTATEHAGLARFTFPEGRAGNILIPISHTLTDTPAAQIRIVDERTIEGQVTCQSFCGAQQYSTVYFVMRLSEPFRTSGTFRGAVPSPENREENRTSDKTTEIGAYVSYPAGKQRVVTARIGVSFVDTDGARDNLDREVGGQSFDQIRKQTAAAWEKNLHAIEVSGGSDDQKTIFYTALYHCLLMPNIFSDTDGRYIGFDGKIHQSPNGRVVYTNFSGWDIYRTEAPLLALIAPERVQDMCQSIVLMYQQGGWIDRWPQANTYTNVMCGSPLTTFIATAWNYGLRDFDMQTAYEGMYKDATQPAPPGKPYAGQSNIAWMNQIHYIPDDKEGYGSVAQTEEDCYAYAALASVARALGKKEDAALLTERALYYRNLFDPETKAMRPRLVDGSWLTPFALTQTRGYIEGSGWHYRWFAPHDVAGLIDLFGGAATFNEQLDAFFERPFEPWNDRYYNAYNETDLQAPFLYSYSGTPWKTQALVRELLGEVYKTTPDGIPGNDDCGTMSAWYIFAAMGIYPVDPAFPAFELCSPLFPQVTVRLSKPYSGKTLTIRGMNASPANAYIQSTSWNGSPFTRPWVKQQELVRGSVLEVKLGAEPSKGWGVKLGEVPPSLSRNR